MARMVYTGILKPIDLVNALPLLRHLGFTLGLDWDDYLTIEVPDSIDTDVIHRIIEHFETEITDHIKSDSRRLRATFIGGPLNGQPSWMVVSRKTLQTPGRSGQFFWYHLAHKRWPVYRFQPDLRAFYLGEATSEKKAKEMAFAALTK